MSHFIKFCLVLGILLVACNEAQVNRAGQPAVSPEKAQPSGAQPNPAILGPGNVGKSNALPDVENAQIDSAEIVTVEGQVMLRLRGALPSACHELRTGIDDMPDGRGLVRAAALAILDRSLPGKSGCAAASTPFEVDLPLDSLPPGAYRVLINEQIELNVEIK